MNEEHEQQDAQTGPLRTSIARRRAQQTPPPLRHSSPFPAKPRSVPAFPPQPSTFAGDARLALQQPPSVSEPPAMPALAFDPTPPRPSQDFSQLFRHYAFPPGPSYAPPAFPYPYPASLAATVPTFPAYFPSPAPPLAGPSTSYHPLPPRPPSAEQPAPLSGSERQNLGRLGSLPVPYHGRNIARKRTVSELDQPGLRSAIAEAFFRCGATRRNLVSFVNMSSAVEVMHQLDELWPSHSFRAIQFQNWANNARSADRRGRDHWLLGLLPAGESVGDTTELSERARRMAQTRQLYAQPGFQEFAIEVFASAGVRADDPHIASSTAFVQVARPALAARFPGIELGQVQRLGRAVVRAHTRGVGHWLLEGLRARQSEAPTPAPLFPPAPPGPL